MARHGHYRHSRIDRLINAKKHREASEGGIADVDELLEVAEPIRSPHPKPSDILPDDVCDPLQNETCLDDAPDTTEASLSKRQVAESPQSTLAPPIVPVVDQNSNSHTVWQSTTDAFPMTIQSPASGTTTSAAESTTDSGTAAISLPTLPILIPTPAITSSTQTPASKPTQTAAISSPSPLPSSSSIPYISTPLVTPTTSAPSLAVSNPSNPSNPSFAIAVTTTTSLTSSSSASDYSGTPSTSTTTTYDGPDKIGTATGTGSGAAPSTGDSQPTSDSGSGSGSGSGPTDKATTPKIVGGVIGSVAGLAMIFLLLFYLLRRRRFFQQKGVQALPSDDAGTQEVAEHRASNDPLFTATYFAPAFVKRWRQSAVSTNTDSTVSSSDPSERGFQKVSGRKIPPVLTHGGDGYGGGLTGDSPTIPGFFPTSPGRGPYSPPISHRPPPTSPYGMPLDTNYTREADEFTTPTRPKAAHLPVSSSVNFGSPTAVNPSHPMAQPQSAVLMSSPPRFGGLDRSSPSFDGSRGSRFTESLDL